MSKYDALWEYLAGRGEGELRLSFEEIRAVTGFDLDHSFLNCKKDAAAYGYAVAKISMKEKWVHFRKVEG